MRLACSKLRVLHLQLPVAVYNTEEEEKEEMGAGYQKKGEGLWPPRWVFLILV